MRLVRAILGLVIAFSLALLPVGASASHGVGPTDVMGATDTAAAVMLMDSSMEMGSAGMSMDDCCPDGMKGPVSHAATDKCNMGFCCAGGMSALDDVRVVMLALLSAKAIKLGIPADQVAAFESDGPPFRPPRV